MLKSVFVILICLLPYGIASAQKARTQPRRVNLSFPPYVVLVTEQSPDSYMLSDSLFNELAGHTIFKVNRTELNTNDTFLRELTESVLPLARAKGLMLVGIDLRGAASPEGSYDNNVRLAKGRASALIEYMSSRLDSVQLAYITPTSAPEDYPRLLWHLEQDGDPSATVVRELIERHGAQECEAIKADLKKVQGGALWSRLLRDYFPRLRSARVVLFFKSILPPVEQIPFPSETAGYEFDPLPVLSLPPLEPIATVVQAPARRRHMLAVSTNLLYDVFYMPNYGWAPMPNVQIEYFPARGKFTYLAGFTSPYYHHWSKNKFFQIRDYHLEVRRYFNPGERHLGAYLALYANANKYGIGLSATKGWQGEGWGGALKAGCVLPLGKGRWRLDLHAAIGAYVTRYDPYVYGNPIANGYDGNYYYDWTGGSEAFHRRNHRFTWFGPTEVGVTLSCDLLFWRRSRGGVSFSSQEYIR